MKKSGAGKQEAKEKIFGKNIQFLYSGGAKLNPEIIKNYKEYGITIGQSYGMTESFLIATGVAQDIQNGSVGLPISCMEHRIAEDGEIQIRGDSVMVGYYKNPEETRKVLTEDGWFSTGDIGKFDDAGLLHITGRKKNLIILKNGENVAPEEIEMRFQQEEIVSEVVLTSFDNFNLAVVIYPDFEWCRENGIEDIYEQLKLVTQKVNDRLPANKRIQKIVMRETEFKKTASKKIIRNQEYC